MSSREQFEAWFSESFPVIHRMFERSGDGYYLPSTDAMWKSWQAASKASEQQLDAVVAENAALKQAITTHSQSTHFCEVCGNDDPCSTDDVCYVLNETPANDAILNEMRAQGVEMFAKEMHADISGDDAREFADKLRQGGAA